MNEKLIIPGSIIIAGCIISAAIYFGGNNAAVPAAGGYPADTAGPAAGPTVVSAKRVDPASDHIQGSPTADIFVLEYSDIECPFCKRYHDGPLEQLKQAYADDERVAFVFRHFPLDEPYTRALHPMATEIHIAAACVGKLGGTDAFYHFVDTMFAAQDRGNESLFAARAAQAGVDEASFTTCYNNKETESIVSAGFQDGANAGVQGTPSVFIQTSDGKTYQAVPDYGALKVAIDAYLAELQ